MAFLTVLGYSLYDTIVVFDRVRDNSRGLGATGKSSYTDVVNLSMNQTLARSINTSLVAILPILAVLVLGAEILGAVTLEYFGLALLIGLTSGAYSSIFIASPAARDAEGARRALPPDPRTPRIAGERNAPDLARGRRGRRLEHCRAGDLGQSAAARRASLPARPATLRPGATRGSSAAVVDEEALDEHGADTGNREGGAQGPRATGAAPGGGVARPLPEHLARARRHAARRHGPARRASAGSWRARPYRHHRRRSQAGCGSTPRLWPMIDIRLAREHPDEFRRTLARKGAGADFENLLTVDELWRDLTTEVDELRRRTRPKGKPTEEERVALVAVSEELRRAETRLEELDRRRSDLLAALPNPPDDSVPDGFADEDALELRRVGTAPEFSFTPRDHVELSVTPGLLRWRWPARPGFDLERGARVAGARFAYRRGASLAWSWPCTATPSIGWWHAASSLSSRRCWCGSRRCTARASCRPTRSISTRSPATGCT